jgi:hypothetical protein
MSGLRYHARDVLTISSFFIEAECAAEIAHAESLGFAEAPVSTDRGAVMMKDLRNNDGRLSA